MARSMRIDTRLRERTSASRRLVGPENWPLAFSGRHEVSAFGSSITIGASRITEAGVKPFSSAAEYRNGRSEEHTSELQSRENLVCRLLLEKKKKRNEKKVTTKR